MAKPIDPDRYTGNESVGIREAAQEVFRIWDNFDETGPVPLDDAMAKLRAAVFDYPQRTPEELAQMRVEAAGPELLAALEQAVGVLEDWDDNVAADEGPCDTVVELKAVIAEVKGA